MVPCCSQYSNGSSGNKTFQLFYPPLKKPRFVPVNHLNSCPLSVAYLLDTTFQNVTPRLRHSPRQIKCSVKALTRRRFVCLDTAVAGGCVTAANWSEICAIQGFHRRGRPLCSLIGRCSIRAWSVIRFCVLIGWWCFQSSANASVAKTGENKTIAFGQRNALRNNVYRHILIHL